MSILLKIIELLKYTYEQILASQAEQVKSKSENIDNLPSLGKSLAKDFSNNKPDNKLKVI